MSTPPNQPYVDISDDEQPAGGEQLDAPAISQEMSPLIEDEDLEPTMEDFAYLAEQEIAPTLQKMGNRRTTDLVRLYLQEIGRVSLLEREEEVLLAQKIQRYMQLLELRQSYKDGSGPIGLYVQLIEVRDRLTAQLGHRPALERWAESAGVKVSQIKPIIRAGKRHWAELAFLKSEELDRIQAEGREAKAHMIKANLRLVVSVAKKYKNRGLELLDLVQEGTLGLERAVEKFDPTKGYRFSTYAYWWIRQGMTRAIATQSRTIRLPVHITEKLNKIKKAQREFAQEKGRTPTIEDIAIKLEITPSQVRDVLLRVPRSVSLETKVGKEKDTELGDLLVTDSISPEEQLMREALYRDLQKLLADLTGRERDVIQMRFGLGDGHPYSLSEVGRALDLSRERVRQIEAKALQKLRQPKRRGSIRVYLEMLT